MNSPGIVYRPRANTTLEVEASTLANIYRFVLDCHAKKAAPDKSDLKDEKGRSNDSLANTSIP
jgi:hypothetical protein